MPKYKCKPWRNVSCFSPTFQVVVSERLDTMPYAQCGFIHVMPPIENHTVKIFVSYITPIFAVIDDEYIVRIWHGKTATTSRQITKALQSIYKFSVLPPFSGTYDRLCPYLEFNCAINLDKGDIIYLPDAVAKFLQNYTPCYCKIGD